MVADPTVAKSYYDQAIGEAFQTAYISPDDAKAAIDKIYADLNSEIASVILSVEGGEGSDEVAVQTVVPSNPSIEIWIDTDENYTPNAVYTRNTTPITTGSLAVGGTFSGNLTLASAYRLYKITTSAPCRVRLYTSTAKRTADTSRPIGTAPTGDHGVAFEFVSTVSLLSSEIVPAVDGYDAKTTPDGLIPISIVNTGTGSATITVSFIWIRTE